MKNPFSLFFLLNPTLKGTCSRSEFSPENTHIHQRVCEPESDFWCIFLQFIHVPIHSQCFSLWTRAVLSHACTGLCFLRIYPEQLTSMCGQNSFLKAMRTPVTVWTVICKLLPLASEERVIYKAQPQAPSTAAVPTANISIYNILSTYGVVYTYIT